MSLVLLDRDGVINEDSDNYIRSADEWRPIEGSIEAIAKLHRAGHQVVVCTNQSGLARNYFQLADLEAMHRKMRALVEQAGGAVAGIYYCPHLPEAGCNCRKPLPGLIDQATADLGLSAKGATFVGDSLKDLEAAQARDCLPVLVTTGKGQATRLKLSEHSSLSDTPVFANLAAFVESFLKGRAST